MDMRAYLTYLANMTDEHLVIAAVLIKTCREGGLSFEESVKIVVDSHREAFAVKVPSGSIH